MGLRLLHDFVEWLHDERAFVHERVGNCQSGLSQAQVVVEQDVDVDGAVLVEW